MRGSKALIIAACFLALVISSLAKPTYDDEDDCEEEEKPKKKKKWGKGGGGYMYRRDETEISSTSSTPTQIGQDQINQLTSEMGFFSQLPASTFEQMSTHLKPKQIQELGESITKIGSQLSAPEVANFGETLAHQTRPLTPAQAQDLREIQTSLYQSMQIAEDPSALLGQLKSQLSSQLSVIQKLSNIIEEKLPGQIGDTEQTEIISKIEQIKTLGNTLQSQLTEASSVAQLSEIGSELLKLQELSNQVQQKISSQVLQNKIQEMASQTGDQASQTSGQSSDQGTNQVSLQARDELSVQQGTQGTSPQEITELSKFLKDMGMFFTEIFKQNKIELETSTQGMDGNGSANIQSNPTTSQNTEQTGERSVQAST